ncbi:hypothetical protein FRB95_001592 [Tulasnella sp. JGI-2019a]|nr:hypothetical protein FRB95_001592 [Tulasnella sp. JGI-2019a]
MSGRDSDAQYPKFRILIVGKSGTGKSTLINRVLNIKTVEVSSYIPGASNIDQEITSSNNPRFILHDSQGFQFGEDQNLAIVRNFIRRWKALELQNQIHAIWLCEQCPSTIGRGVKSENETLLKEDLGLPVILVFTKYDIILDTMESEIRDDPENDECEDDEIEALVSKRAEEDYERSCIKPLDAIGATDLPHTRVSVHDKGSINQLVELTGQLLHGRIIENGAYITRKAPEVTSGASDSSKLEGFCGERIQQVARNEVIARDPEYIHQSAQESSLRSPEMSTQDMIAQCPKFGILVLGKSGTGKSTLINRVFNIKTACVSTYTPGASNIHQEITSPDNPRFVLHESQDFESGEGQNLAMVKNFIRGRKAMKIEDQIHAVWLCVRCPSSNDRAIEAGDEDLLKEDFGLPVVLIFTKYDIIRDAKESEIRDDSENDQYGDAEIEALVSEKAEEDYQRSCIKPLEAVGINLQHTRVSVHDKRSINMLVELTSQLLRGRVGDTAWTIWGVVQRVSIHEKINAYIA